MAETHINAFFGAVDEAKLKVVQAKGELQAAEDALAVKKKEVGWEEEKPQAAEPASKTEPVEDTKSKDSKKK